MEPDADKDGEGARRMGNQAARSRRRAAERRRELRRRERAVVDAARLLCEPSGWSGVSSRGLAARSGVSTSRVHALFGSLDGVWAAVERAVWDDLRDGLLIEDDPLTLTAYLEHCLWFAGENPGEWQVLASGDGPPCATSWSPRGPNLSGRCRR